MADVMPVPIRLDPPVHWVTVYRPKVESPGEALGQMPVPVWRGRAPSLYHVAGPTDAVALVDDSGNVARFGATMIEVQAAAIDWSQTTASAVVCLWRA